MHKPILIYKKLFYFFFFFFSQVLTKKFIKKNWKKNPEYLFNSKYRVQPCLPYSTNLQHNKDFPKRNPMIPNEWSLKIQEL